MSHILLPDGRRLGTGDRIHAQGFIAKPEGTYSISGGQRKLVGDFIEVTGTVLHVRGNHPTDPTRIWISLQVENEREGSTFEEVCTTGKHPGVPEHTFEYHPAIKFDFLPPKED